MARLAFDYLSLFLKVDVGKKCKNDYVWQAKEREIQTRQKIEKEFPPIMHGSGGHISHPEIIYTLRGGAKRSEAVPKTFQNS